MPSPLHRLRGYMTHTSEHVKEPLQAYIVPSQDAHQSVYVNDSDKRRAFICGFKGSAGTAVITKDKAALWTDSRFFVQAERELDHHHFTLMKMGGGPDEVTISAWLKEVLPQGSNVGIDPMYISGERWEELEHNLTAVDLHLVAVEENLVDLVWTDRPHHPLNPIVVLPIDLTGKLWVEKVHDVRELMKENMASALVVTALDEVAWLFNLRGSDIDYTPVFFSYVILTMSTILWFVASKKVTSEVQAHLHSASNVTCNVVNHPYHHIKKHLLQLIKTTDGKIWISKRSSYALTSLVPRNRWCLEECSPIERLKSVKNPSEITGMQAAHLKDAVAMCEFWAWMAREVPNGTVTEMTAIDTLEKFLKEQEDYLGFSFGARSQSGPNSAAAYYRPTPETDRTVNTYEIYLLDVGSQYRDGTTDLARTTHFGTPSAHEKECYTAVLKGHIALSSIIFPPFTKGVMVDSLARAALWKLGLDYGHVTGHGVGCHLCVHEGPVTIRRLIKLKNDSQDPGMQAGMTLAIEPGYYEVGKFGIRIENIVMVKKIDTKYKPLGEDYLAFEPLTFVPIDTNMIEISMLEKHEISWLNGYHLMCREIVAPTLLEKGLEQAHDWLMAKTTPI